MTDSLLRALVARNRWLLARPAASALLVSLRRLVSAIVSRADSFR